MSKDISKILEGWEFQPDEVLVRIVLGDDGRERLQLRVDLGVLQMETEGRPDGVRPEGYESWLEVYQEKQRIHEATHPDSVPFQLSDEDCLRLWREGVQYYHRYLGLWHLQRYEQCARDTERNLRLFAFVKAYAQGDRNKLQFDQWRPYVTMMHTRSLATPLAERKQFDRALRVVDAGIDAIRDFLDEYNQTDRAEQCAELANLEQWREEIVAKAEETAGTAPRGTLLALRRKLQEAVARERFEEAARLRDEIRRLSGKEQA
jgi:DNA-binding transcriptional MerR regulator